MPYERKERTHRLEHDPWTITNQDNSLRASCSKDGKLTIHLFSSDNDGSEIEDIVEMPASFLIRMNSMLNASKKYVPLFNVKTNGVDNEKE